MVETRILLAGGDDEGYHDFQVIGDVFFSFLTGAGFQVTLTEDCQSFCKETIKNYDVVVFYMNKKQMKKNQEQGLLNSIIGSPWGDTGKPKGFVGIHTAACSVPGSMDFRRMLGCRFLVHPEMGEELHIHVKNPGHPVMQGVEDFSIIDELYMLELYPPFELLLSCRYKGFEHPVAWAKPYGLGRVFYISLGHGVEQISHEYYKKMIINAVIWSAGL
jgi:uncharacterized protein